MEAKAVSVSHCQEVRMKARTHLKAMITWALELTGLFFSLHAVKLSSFHRISWGVAPLPPGETGLSRALLTR